MIETCHPDELMEAADRMRAEWMIERKKMARAIAAILDIMETEDKELLLCRVPLEARIELERAVIIARQP